MTTKDIFLSLVIAGSYEESAEKLDFNKIDEFVSNYLRRYLTRKGRDTVHDELLADHASETTIFLSRLIEVGTAQFLSDNDLITQSDEADHDVAVIAAHAINIAIASELVLLELHEASDSIFFNVQSLNELIDRIFFHIRHSREDRFYIPSLINFNLVSLTGENAQ